MTRYRSRTTTKVLKVGDVIEAVGERVLGSFEVVAFRRGEELIYVPKIQLQEIDDRR